MSDRNANYTLGVYGGVGPLASCKFVESIYKTQSNIANIEQEYSKIILLSDPSMPERTEYFLKGLKQGLLNQLTQGLYQLIQMGVDEIVICCFTLHYILQDLPDDLINKVISLPCLALKEVLQTKKRSLLICSSGSMNLNVFEASPYWEPTKDYIIKPDVDDQLRIHQTIFMLKKSQGHVEAINFINEMLKKYDAQAWIVGCTEFHLLSSDFNFSHEKSEVDKMIDPLLLVAEYVSSKQSHIVAQIDKTQSFNYENTA